MVTKVGGSVSPDKIQDNTKTNKLVINSSTGQLEFTTNNTLQGILDSSGNFILGTGSGASGIEVVRSSASTDFGLKLTNNSNGDIKLTMETAAQTFSLGIDNSDNDYLKLSTSSTDVNTGTLWTVKNDGSLGIGVVPTSKLHVDGSISQTITSLTSATTLDNTHSIVHADSTGGAFTIALPAASTCSGRVYTITKIDASANAITIDPASTETIQGDLTRVLNDQYDRLSIRSDGTGWSVEVINLLTPVNNEDSATKSYVDSVTSSQNELSELTDVTFTSLATGQMMYSTDGSNWANSSNLYWDETNDRLGINTSSPESPLHIVGTETPTPTAAGVHLASPSGGGYATVALHNTLGGYIDFGNAGEDFSGRLIYFTADNSMRFYTNGSNERLQIDSVGNIGIGTTAPNFLLDVQGNDLFRLRSTNNTTAKKIAEFTHSKGTANVLDGDFHYFNFVSDSDTTAEAIVSQIGAVADDVTHATRTSSISMLTMTNGVIAEELKVNSTGLLMGGGTLETTNADLCIKVSGSECVQIANDSVNIIGNSTESLSFSVGNGRTGNGFSFIDLVGDATYTDYGTRLIRGNTGPNANSTLDHRGTGSLILQALEAGDVKLRTNGVDRLIASSSGVDFNSHKGINLLDPTNAQDAATKAYVDSIAAGLDPKESVTAATTANLSGYSPTGGTSGTGGFTNIDTTTFDGHTMSNGDRVLVLNQTDPKQNGIYVITTLNATTGAMERATDHDGTPSNEVSGGNTTFVENGTTYGGQTWALQGDGELALNTDNLVWQLLSNAQDWTWGTGLTATGNTVNLTANLTDLQDVSTSSLATGQLLYKSAGDWNNASNLYWTGSSFGIGTATPSALVDISDGITVRHRIVPGSSTVTHSTRNFSNTGYQSAKYDATQHIFQNSGVETMRMDSSNNFLIGTTTNPSSDKLRVEGTKSLTAGIPYGQLGIVDNTSYAAGVGGGILFDGKYNSGGGITTFGSIEGVKENSTDGNFAGNLVFKTRVNGGNQFERMRIDSTGNVLIGTTTNPGAYRLNVTDDDGTGSLFDFTSTAASFVINSPSAGKIGLNSGSGDTLSISTNGSEALNITTAGELVVLGQGTAAAPILRLGNEGDTGFYYRAANDIGISTAGSERVTIDTGGLVLRNGGQLTLENGSAATPSTRFANSATTGTFRAGDDIFGISTAGTERIRVDATGKVGVGTTNPTTLLSVRGSSSSLFSITGTANTSALTMGEIYHERGTSNVADEDFHYFNWVADSDTTVQGLIVQMGMVSEDVTHATRTAGIKFTTMNSGSITEKMRIKGNGTIQFNSYGAGTLSTDASGNISASDGRLKNKLNREVLGSSVIMALSPTWYTWKEDSFFDSTFPELGFIAQEVGNVIPEAAPGTDETVEIRNFHDRAILASLVKHNQELQQEKESLTNKVNNLEDRLAKLEALLTNDLK